MLCMKIKQQAGYFLQQGYRDRTVIYSVYRSAARESSGYQYLTLIGSYLQCFQLFGHDTVDIKEKLDHPVS